MRTKENFLVFSAPAIEDAEIQELVASLKSGWLGTGPKVARFEADFKTYKGARHAVAVNSCTAALHLSLLAAGLQPGNEVITTPLTLWATLLVNTNCSFQDWGRLLGIIWNQFFRIFKRPLSVGPYFRMIFAGALLSGFCTQVFTWNGPEEIIIVAGPA